MTMTDAQSPAEIEDQLNRELTGHAMRRLAAASEVPTDVLDDVMTKHTFSSLDQAILYIGLDDLTDDPSGIPNGHPLMMTARIAAEMGRLAPLLNH